MSTHQCSSRKPEGLPSPATRATPKPRQCFCDVTPVRSPTDSTHPAAKVPQLRARQREKKGRLRGSPCREAIVRGEREGGLGPPPRSPQAKDFRALPPAEFFTAKLHFPRFSRARVGFCLWTRGFSLPSPASSSLSLLPSPPRFSLPLLASSICWRSPSLLLAPTQPALPLASSPRSRSSLAVVERTTTRRPSSRNAPTANKCPGLTSPGVHAQSQRTAFPRSCFPARRADPEMVTRVRRPAVLRTSGEAAFGPSLTFKRPRQRGQQLQPTARSCPRLLCS